MVKGLTYSLIIHTVLLLLIGIGLPSLFDRDREMKPVAISVEILPIKDISNVPSRPKPIKREEQTAKPKPKPAPPKPKPVVKAEQPKPVVAPPKPEPEPKKPEKPKPEPKKPEPKKPETPKPDAFDQLLKDLTEQAESETPDKPEAKESSTTTQSDSYDPSIPLSLSEKDAISSQFYQYWRLPAGVVDDYKLAVEVRVLLNPDGSIKQSGIAKHQVGRYQSDPVFRAAADSALRAVQLASPLKHLPADKYQTWKDMVINFDPKDMLY